MVAIFEPENFDLLGQAIAGDLVACAELVARSLADQSRRLQAFQMLRRLPGR